MRQGEWWFDRVFLLLEVLGAMTVATGLFMVGSRIVHGHWPACGW